MDEATKEALKNLDEYTEASKRRDCAEYGDCFSEPEIFGCVANCPAYNKAGRDGVEPLPCPNGCDELSLEVGHITYARWAVQCWDCGRLGSWGVSEKEAIENWNAGKVSREGEMKKGER